MPAKGAAILSQIEGLLEQLTELDYDTPAKQWASDLMPQVTQMAEELRASSEMDAPDEELPEVTEGTEPPAPRPSEDSQASTIEGARGPAKEFLNRAKTQEEQPGEKDEEEDPRRKKRAKAY